MLRSCGCGLRSLHEPWIDTTTAMGKALYHITIAWAALEREVLIERTRAGMERARAEGKRIGRKPRKPIEQHHRWEEVRDLVRAGTLTKAEGARRLRVRYETSSAPPTRARRGQKRPSAVLVPVSDLPPAANDADGRARRRMGLLQLLEQLESGLSDLFRLAGAPRLEPRPSTCRKDSPVKRLLRALVAGGDKTAGPLFRHCHGRSAAAYRRPR